MMKSKLLIFFLYHIINITASPVSTWISHPEPSDGIFFFRKSFVLNSIPSNFIIEISADSRFVLYVNNFEVLTGPLYSDVNNWKYHSVDIAGQLKSGRNVISVELIKWDDLYLLSSKNTSALFIQGKDKNSVKVNSSENNGWKTYKSKSHYNIQNNNKRYLFEPGYDSIDFTNYPWNWQTVDYDDKHWKDAVFAGNIVYKNYGISPWNLDSIPAVNLIPDTSRFNNILYHSSPEEISSLFLFDNGDLVVPEKSSLRLIIAAEKLIYGFTNIKISKGKTGIIKIHYSESLRDLTGIKINRNEPIGTVTGPTDIFFINGGTNQIVKSTSEKTCRFIDLEIITDKEEIQIKELYLNNYVKSHSNYASFTCNDESLCKIWNAGAYTIDILSQNLLYSSVSNEKVQFLPEAWAVSLALCYFNGNSIPMKEALNMFYRSLIPDGLVNSCAPCNTNFLIPHYSLYYILMLYDYFFYTGDINFVKKHLTAVENILEWYQDQINDKDVISITPYDMNVKNRINNSRINYGTAFNTVLYIYTLQMTAKLYEKCGIKEIPVKYYYLIEKLKKGIIKQNYNNSKKLLIEDTNSDRILKITNIFALLAEIYVIENIGEHLMSVIHSKEMDELTLFERFFLGRLLNKLQDGEIYKTQILPWHNMILDGLTTLGDDYYNTTGTDIYGGGVTPCLNLIKLTAGISAYNAGYSKIMIAPEPGELEYFSLSCFIPYGKVKVLYEKKTTGEIIFEIELPQEVTGYLKWNEKLTSLLSGFNRIEK